MCIIRPLLLVHTMPTPSTTIQTYAKLLISQHCGTNATRLSTTGYDSKCIVVLAAIDLPLPHSVSVLPLCHFFLRRRYELVGTTCNQLLHVGLRRTWHHLLHALHNDLFLLRVQTLQHSIESLYCFCILCIFLGAFLFTKRFPSFLLCYQLCDDLLLLCDRHRLHTRLQCFLLGFRHLFT